MYEEHKGEINPSHNKHDDQHVMLSKRQKSLKNNGPKLKMHPKQIPLAVLYTFYQLIKRINDVVKIDQDKGKHKRIRQVAQLKILRHPRYFGLTKQLEQYSSKKSLAVEIMKNGNFMNKHSLGMANC